MRLPRAEEHLLHPCHAQIYKMSGTKACKDDSKISKSLGELDANPT